ncbi:acyl-CoA dehydrogenase family protein [Rhodococcus sp. NPDC059968]|uniref:acyl-CoA dehydrogenase family protein n=1 Tax=Rhodococcus sp. NPDC059968 TaxID=3347017 RepID=UPI00366D7D31
MDYLDSPEEAEFRTRLRKWLADSNVPDWRKASSIEEARPLIRQWTSALNDAGYLALTWPVAEGGQGLSPVYNMILNQEIGAAECPEYPGTINIFARMISIHGTDEQREKFLPATFNGDIIWCQGFSEPDAGSDLANMSTSAVRHGDTWVVNGQKLWTTYAVYSDWCFLLARTSSEGPKHRGISAFLVPLDTLGVQVRAVHLANDDPETGEVFWDNVEIPDKYMLGNPGDGWKIAMSTFTYERNPAETHVMSELRAWLREAERLAATHGVLDDPVIRRRLADMYTRIEGLQYVGLEQVSARVKAAIAQPGEESSVGKLLWTYAGQQLQHLILDIVGARTVVDTRIDPMHDYVWSRVLSVLGGTAQIQKNILAWRVLGLPRA